MLLHKPKKNTQKKGNRFLITVTFLGSAGPIRFVVNEEDLVAAVIDTALKSYAREGRLPVLGSDLNDFLLYCANAGSDALSPWETIGSGGVRNFVLYKKPLAGNLAAGNLAAGNLAAGNLAAGNLAAGNIAAKPMIRKRNGNWKSWINKSLNLKISSH